MRDWLGVSLLRWEALRCVNHEILVIESSCWCYIGSVESGKVTFDEYPPRSIITGDPLLLKLIGARTFNLPVSLLTYMDLYMHT